MPSLDFMKNRLSKHKNSTNLVSNCDLNEDLKDQLGQNLPDVHSLMQGEQPIGTSRNMY